VTQRQTFNRARESVGQARRFVTQAIRGAPGEVIETVALMASELASNCVRHADSQFEMAVIQAGPEIRVEATDRGRGEPVLRNPAPTDPTGRGLQIVDMLAEDWGVEPLAGRGKTVWFTVLVPAADRVGHSCPA